MENDVQEGEVFTPIAQDTNFLWLFQGNKGALPDKKSRARESCGAA